MLSLYPTHHRDPNLWTVKCRIGTEKETVMLLMRKYISLRDSDTVRMLMVYVMDVDYMHVMSLLYEF